ncbi:hypothetical protein M422DRAFT_29634 [Sphaerobolus stellatus SS14]|uniref:BHLH domain-containing protein n=1 Tax=Sphaerobolus stellatus (strain SS14) TaxID=990650 RepID=A0A0C9VES0_SPHS4|nr:hypothetical protein M422DRAFT_29634 [Sphaerobolus stellatus SS14]
MDDDFDPSNDLAVAVDDALLTPIFHEDATSSSSNSSGSPRRHDEWSLPSYFSPTQSSASPLKPGLLNMNLDDISFSNLLQSAASNHMHPWATMDIDSAGDMSLGSIISDDSQYAIDPSSLHFGSYGVSQQDTQSSLDTMFQFTVTQPFEDTQVPTPTPASSSSESRDTSPSPAHTPSPPGSIASIDPNDLDLYAQRAREATGIVLAVKVPTHQSQQHPHMPISPVSPMLHESQVPPKVPIPRLRPTLGPGTGVPAPFNVKNSPKPESLPTPPSTDIPERQYSSAQSAPQPATNAPAQQLTKTGRPKTSHTTIERRYRTNLNARILALKRAVPALRILEKNLPQPQQGKGLTGASAPRWDFNDVINERGYVDGVKAAKKNSKGVVLGKAVEYIRALKRREIRLKREAEGLRALLTGLVGGAELLNEWEQDWRARFGGDEMDEVEEGEGDEDDEGDGEDDDEDDEDDGRSKKRKRGDTNSPSAPAVVVEKRKRGRPRKNPLPSTPQPVVLTTTQGPLPHLSLHPAGVQAQQTQQSTFFLAGIMLFNFFWTEGSAKATGGHEGTVLTHAATAPAVPASFWDFLTLSRVVNLLALTAILVPLVTPYLSRVFSSPSVEDLKEKETEAEGLNILQEKLELGSATGTARALFDRLASTIMLGMKPKDVASQLKAWRIVGGDLACRDAAVSTSFGTRMHAYLSYAKLVRSTMSSNAVTPSDCITLSFLIRSFSMSSAVAWWDKAKALLSQQGTERDNAILEQIVLDLGIEKAGDILILGMSEGAVSDSLKALDPVEIIAAHIVKERMKEVAREQFVDVVLKTNASSNHPSSALSHSQLISASRILGSQVAELGKLLDRLQRGCPAEDLLPSSPSSSTAGLGMDSELEFDFEFGWSSGGSSASDSGSDAGNHDEEKSSSVPHHDEAKLFLMATVLYMRVCADASFSISDIEKAKESLALRRALASEVFDSEEVEEARDKVVDLLAEC